MPASEAQIRANQANAKLSTGPRTPEGKEASRANALKHGLTGAGVVMPAADVAEVESRAASIAAETNASGVVGHTLARIAALNSVRIERGADQQAAALAEHVRRVDAEFVPPEGLDEAQAAGLRDEATRRAMVADERMLEETLASLFELSKRADAIEGRQAKRAMVPPSKPQNRVEPGYQTPIEDIFDVPIAIGRPR
jgi:hypothetical protein